MSEKQQILIIDYGLGNLNSVARGIAAAGGNPQISKNPSDLSKAEKTILPGVGAFAAGMYGLRKRKFIKPILDYVNLKKELFGLCLGMQLLFDKSSEFGDHKGLGLIEGQISILHTKDQEIFKIPHVGWNSLIRPKGVVWKCTILENINEGDMVYFVHSFAPPLVKSTLASAEYGGVSFSSVVAKNSVYGTQFHPEKSGEVGQKILKKFLEL